MFIRPSCNPQTFPYKGSRLSRIFESLCRNAAILCLLCGVNALLRAEEPQMSRSEDMVPKEFLAASSAKPRPTKPPVESNLVVEGLASYGNYKIFASGYGCKLYTAGFEYDRHSWGYLLKARMDYVAEFLPMILLQKPNLVDYYGTPKSYGRHVVPGIGFSPIGFRLLWRDQKAIKPYLMAKGGMLVFNEKVPARQATYENFSLQSAMGVLVKVKPRVDVRLGLFSDFHFSNAFIVDSNPGLDVMNANLGISYRLDKPVEQ